MYCEHGENQQDELIRLFAVTGVFVLLQSLLGACNKRYIHNALKTTPSTALYASATKICLRSCRLLLLTLVISRQINKRVYCSRLFYIFSWFI